MKFISLLLPMLLSKPALGQVKNQSSQIDMARKTTLPMELVFDKEELKGTPFLYINHQETNLIPSLQAGLRNFVKRRGDPIAAVMVAEVSTGKILALVQGKSPKKWGAKTHTALHTGFPAASLFKTIVASAAIEVAGVATRKKRGLVGGCARVRPSGRWMVPNMRGKQYQIDMKVAYGHSCNGFFAKLALNNTGLGPLIAYAHRFGWDRIIPADFDIPKSPITVPMVGRSSAHTIGKFAAGFGNVKSSTAHALWRILAIGNNGIPQRLSLFTGQSLPHAQKPIIKADTSKELRDIMKKTVRGGTASSAFARGKYRQFKNKVGGKTGTLTGKSPSGVTTWFSGLYPIENPEIAVTALTVINDYWIFKAPNLAAEAIYLWHKQKKIMLSKAKVPNIKKTELR